MHSFAVEEPLAGPAPTPRRSRSVLATFLVLVLLGQAEGLQVNPATGARTAHKAAVAVQRGGAPAMDETVFQKALAGELEAEGAENHWMSEAGWAEWLDKNAESSYNMNQRPSKMGKDKYFTPTAFSHPLDVAFPTISNDVTGKRSFP